MAWEVSYSQRENARVPVLAFLSGLEPKLRAKALHETELLEKYGLTLRGPYVKASKGKKYQGLDELRIKFSSHNARIFYFVSVGREMILLSGYIKTSKITPKGELELALSYKLDYERRGKE